MLILVCATRHSPRAFERDSLLGPCLRRLGEFQTFGLKLAHGNTNALAEHYNAAIESAAPEDVLVFLHDDVRVDDWMFAQRLEEALAQFDVVGVAGNRRVQPRQVTWYLQPESTEPGVASLWDHGWLSGAICHGAGPGRLSVYGPSPQPVRLIDGVFIAARAKRLQLSNVRFDPSLAFHFYDLDFSLSAHQAGLRLGTWPIALTHASGGDSIHTKAWQASRLIYLRKWFDDRT